MKKALEPAIKRELVSYLTAQFAMSLRQACRTLSLRRQGNCWNHKRVHRIYCRLKLNFRRKGKQRLPLRNPAPLATPEAMNQHGSVDFMHDALVCGRRLRTFNVVDDFNRGYPEDADG